MIIYLSLKDLFMHFATVHQASTPYPTPSPKRVLSFYSSEKIHTYIYILLEAPSSSYLSWKLIYMGVCVCVCVCVCYLLSCLTLCDPMNCSQPARLLCPWNSSGKNTGVGSHSVLQSIFLTQGSNLGLLH